MTLTELYRRVLLKLRVVDATEAATAEDTQLVEDAYSAVYDMLLTEGLVAWTSTEDVPLYAELPMISMVACYVAKEFGKEPDYLDGALNLAPSQGGPSRAERLLRRQLAKNYIPYPVQSDYF